MASGKVNVMEHPTQVFVPLRHIQFILWPLITFAQQRKVSREFACAHTGLMKALSFAGTTIELIEVFANVVIAASLAGHLKVRFDHIGHISQNR